MNKLLIGDCRIIMPRLIEQGIQVQTCITSPPYFGLRDYGHHHQLGQEAGTDEYVANLVQVFAQVRRLLRDDGTLWLNLGDSYAGSGKGRHTNGIQYLTAAQQYQHGNKGSAAGLLHRCKPQGCLKPKNLIGIPWRVALTLQADGWYLRQDIIWHKPNPMPQSVTDRCVTAHEYLFLLSKSEHYYFDHLAIQEPAATWTRPAAQQQNSFIRTQGKYAGQAVPGQRIAQHRSGRNDYAARPMRNKRSVWTIPTAPNRHQHIAAFPQKLIEPCILAGSAAGDVVFDPFMGSGTVAAAANRFGRQWLGIELNPDYAGIHTGRVAQAALAL